MIILGIETSCDETAAAVVSDDRAIKAQYLRSQMTEHTPFGGVVPELAARAHLDSLQGIIANVMEEAGVNFHDLDGVAAAGGPGLIGGVIAGVMMAKAISAAQNIPFLAVNHLAAHALTVRLTHDVEFPFLLLLVSGGHCQILIVHRADDFQVLGGTIDDAVGEAYDKTARVLANIYPGGPFIEQMALRGDAKRFTLPRPLLNQKDPTLQFSFSFSGLKTAVRHLASTVPLDDDQTVADICAAFQSAVSDILVDRCRNALAYCKAAGVPLSCIAVAGGVAANQFLRQRLSDVAQRFELELLAPPIPLCTDNAAMIGWAGIEKLQLGQVDSLDFSPRPRWPLERSMVSRNTKDGVA